MRAPAGALDHRFDLEESNGEETPTWTPIGKVWGSLEGLSSTTLAGTQTTATHRIRTRYRSDRFRKQRLREGSRVFKIVAAPLDIEGRQEGLELLVEEHLA
jgi:SPP1 family predicted phage head-tail adaptor